ncbi:MAG: hypothetical protein JST31_06345 [Actinobacteria bacterium]|nr:hypothetical protein [Actinomycetota bacterium]
MASNVIAVVTDSLHGDGPVEEISRCVGGAKGAVRLVVPAVEPNPLRHVLGDVDEPRELAHERLEASLRYLRQRGIEASGEVGDSDPIQAAQDALLRAPADEVIFFEYEPGHARWFEGGMFQHAKESLEPPLRMVILDGGANDAVVDIQRRGPGAISGVEHEVGTSYLPGLSRSDFSGMVVGIAGTVVAAILAAVAAADQGTATGWAAVAIGVGIGTGLVTMAHVVALGLMEAVRYRGGFAKFFHRLSLVGTPIAVLINLAIVLFA